MSPSSINREIEAALEELDLPKLITREDIKKRYRQLARKYHPDMSGAEDRMESINRAYELLIHYVDAFRYRFDDEEISQQFPEGDHAQKFRF